MNSNRSISPRESLEIHELLSFKNLCATKSAMMKGLVKDESLRNLFETDINMSKEQISELKCLIENAAPMYGPANNQEM